MGVGVRVSAVAIGVAATTLASIGVDSAGAERQTAPIRVPLHRFPEPQSGSSLTVSRGDSLWRIAEDHIETVVGEGLSSRQISQYWRSLIELNVGRLRSGDPDLIYPGEVIALPEIAVSGPP